MLILPAVAGFINSGLNWVGDLVASLRNLIDGGGHNHVSALGAIVVFLLFSGCKTTIEYVPMDHKAVPMDHNGIQGWFVPDGVFSLILEKAERYDEILKKEEDK